MNIRQFERFERKCVIWVRMLPFVAVIASVVGSALMMYTGLVETVEAVFVQVRMETGDLPMADESTIKLISALDRFLVAIVLLYFAFGIYSLFVRAERHSQDLGIPKWLRVAGIGELKQTLAEVIVVVLFVLFLRVALEAFIVTGPALSWEAVLKLLTLPVAIFLLSASLKLAELHPKRFVPPAEPPGGPDRKTPEDPNQKKEGGTV